MAIGETTPSGRGSVCSSQYELTEKPMLNCAAILDLCNGKMVRVGNLVVLSEIFCSREWFYHLSPKQAAGGNDESVLD